MIASSPWLPAGTTCWRARGAAACLRRAGMRAGRLRRCSAAADVTRRWLKSPPVSSTGSPLRVTAPCLRSYLNSARLPRALRQKTQLVAARSAGRAHTCKQPRVLQRLWLTSLGRLRAAARTCKTVTTRVNRGAPPGHNAQLNRPLGCARGSAAVSSGGTVYCWGAAADGQTGTGAAPGAEPTAAPTPVLGPRSAAAAGAGRALSEACVCAPLPLQRPCVLKFAAVPSPAF